jgi:hypothetical protein
MELGSGAGAERPSEIGDDRLDADGQPDHLRSDAGLDLIRDWHLSMDGWVAGQGL